MKDIIGIVVIGRNEGQRLKSCLMSVKNQLDKIVYVDSGSTDDSVSYARSIGSDVVDLDMSIPFSAARARNEGFFFITEKYENLKYVQFIDGDCNLAEGWITTAYDFLEEHASFAIVTGQRQEKFPESSRYNMLCDIEWNTKIGEAKASGGDFLIRVASFREVGGFNPSVIAGEEPELCYRLRKNKWRIFRIDHVMSFHDAAMTKFSQWWKRAKRAGHAYAHGCAIHFSDYQGYNVKNTVKNWMWCLFYPLAIIPFGIFFNKLFLLAFLIYPVRFIRIFYKKNRELRNLKKSFLYSIFTFIADFPQLLGQLVFWRKFLLKKEFKIIEHK